MPILKLIHCISLCALIMTGGDTGFTVPPKPMAELHEMYASAARSRAPVDGGPASVDEIKTERLEAFKVKLQKQENLEW